MPDPFDDEFPDFPSSPPVSSAAPNQAPDLSVQFSFDLTTVIGQSYDGSPITLADRVAEIVSTQVVQKAGQEWYPRVRATADEVANRLVEERFRDVLEREFVPTDGYGSPKGEPTTINELITKRAEAWLTEKHSSRGQATSQTRLAHLIDEAIGRAFETEIKKVVTAAQAQATAAVAVKAAEVFAEIIRRAAT